LIKGHNLLSKENNDDVSNQNTKEPTENKHYTRGFSEDPKYFWLFVSCSFQQAKAKSTGLSKLDRQSLTAFGFYFEII
jgi:alpha-mannosidase